MEKSKSISQIKSSVALDNYLKRLNYNSQIALENYLLVYGCLVGFSFLYFMFFSTKFFVYLLSCFKKLNNIIT